jgi:uncharacterized delta-60 repeat protein
LKTDGTAAGTAFVVGVPLAEGMTRAGGRIFFIAYTSQLGRELWATDGTAAGTGVVKDILPGSPGSMAQMDAEPLAAIGDRLVFMAFDGAFTWNPWVSDGTAAGTYRISDAFVYGDFTRVGDAIFFSGAGLTNNRQELWKTDGTPAGTVLVKNLGNSQPAGWLNRIWQLTAVNGRLFFAANTGSVKGTANLWTSDGTPMGTVVVKGGLTGHAFYFVQNLTNVGGTLAMTVYEPIGNSAVYGVWTSDGTTEGTRRIRHTFAFNDQGAPGNIGALGTVMLFTANDGVGGPELWAFQTSSNPPLPQARARGPFPYAVDEGGMLALHGFTTSQPWPSRPLTYEWDLDGDGVFGEIGAAALRGDETGTDPMLRATGLDGPAAHAVAFRISDPTGYTSTDSATVTLRNVAPTLTATGTPSVLVERNPYTLTLAASDPGPDTIAQWQIHWGDGTSTTISGSVKSLTHRYPDGYGSYGVEVLATDEDGTYRADRAASLDATFGTNGVVTSNIAEREDAARNVVVQRDGKIVTVSTLQLSGQSSHRAILVSRYAPDGSPDASFGVNGRVQFNPLPDMYAGGVTVMPDDRIVVSGSGGNGSVLLGLLPDGSPDPSFGPTGWRGYDFGMFDTVAELTTTSDGRIVGGGIGGGTGTGADRRTLLVRFNPNGTLDTTFGTGGTVIVTDFIANNRGVWNLTLQPDGKILVVPQLLDSFNEFRVLRFDPSGSPDPSFDGDGTATVNFGAYSDIATSLALAGDGRIVLGGVAYRTANFSGEWDTALSRLNANGSIDPTFGDGGRWRSQPPGTGLSIPVVRMLHDARILLGGVRGSGSAVRWQVTRFLADGTIDAGYGNAGTFVIDASGTSGLSTVHEMALQRDGAALLYGDAGSAEALVRVVPPGPSARVTDTAVPIVAIDGEASTDEGSTYVLNLSATDPDNDGIARWIVNWGDGTAQVIVGNPAAAQHVYADGPRAWTIRASAIDHAGSITRATSPVSVANLAPTANLTAPVQAVRGARVQFAGSFMDPGADTHQVAWDFGDGGTIGFQNSTNPDALTPRHAYNRLGTFTVTFRVRDDDGAVTTATRQITIVATQFAMDSAGPRPPAPALPSSPRRDDDAAGSDEEEDAVTSA